MDTLHVNIKHALNCIERNAIESLLPDVLAAKNHLVNGDAAGNDFLGWVNLPEEIDVEMLRRLKEDVQRLQKKSQVMVVVGIGDVLPRPESLLTNGVGDLELGIGDICAAHILRLVGIDTACRIVHDRLRHVAMMVAERD